MSSTNKHEREFSSLTHSKLLKKWRTGWIFRKIYILSAPGLYGRAFVHLSTRPLRNGPSSEYVHEIDGLSSSTVRLRPSRTNNHGLSSEFVHEVDSQSSSGRLPPSEFVHAMVGLSQKFRSIVHKDGWTGRRSGDGRLRPWRPGPHSDNSER